MCVSEDCLSLQPVLFPFLSLPHRGTAIPALNDVVSNIQRSLNRLISDVVRSGVVVRRELEELGRESAPGATPKPGRSPLKAKADRLEKSKALREAQAVGCKDWACVSKQVRTWCTVSAKWTLAGSQSQLKSHTHETPNTV